MLENAPEIKNRSELDEMTVEELYEYHKKVAEWNEKHKDDIRKVRDLERQTRRCEQAYRRKVEGGDEDDE